MAVISWRSSSCLSSDGSDTANLRRVSGKPLPITSKKLYGVNSLDRLSAGLGGDLGEDCCHDAFRCSRKRPGPLPHRPGGPRHPRGHGTVLRGVRVQLGADPREHTRGYRRRRAAPRARLLSRIRFRGRPIWSWCRSAAAPSGARTGSRSATSASGPRISAPVCARWTSRAWWRGCTASARTGARPGSATTRSAGGLWIELVHTSFKSELSGWIADTLRELGEEG